MPTPFPFPDSTPPPSAPPARTPLSSTQFETNVNKLLQDELDALNAQTTALGTQVTTLTTQRGTLTTQLAADQAEVGRLQGLAATAATGGPALAPTHAADLAAAQAKLSNTQTQLTNTTTQLTTAQTQLTAAQQTAALTNTAAPAGAPAGTPASGSHATITHWQQQEAAAFHAIHTARAQPLFNAAKAVAKSNQSGRKEPQHTTLVNQLATTAQNTQTAIQNHSDKYIKKLRKRQADEIAAITAPATGITDPTEQARVLALVNARYNQLESEFITLMQDRMTAAEQLYHQSLLIERSCKRGNPDFANSEDFGINPAQIVNYGTSLDLNEELSISGVSMRKAGLRRIYNTIPEPHLLPDFNDWAKFFNTALDVIDDNIDHNVMKHALSGIKIEDTKRGITISDLPYKNLPHLRSFSDGWKYASFNSLFNLLTLTPHLNKRDKGDTLHRGPLVVECYVEAFKQIQARDPSKPFDIFPILIKLPAQDRTDLIKRMVEEFGDKQLGIENIAKYNNIKNKTLTDCGMPPRFNLTIPNSLLSSAATSGVGGSLFPPPPPPPPPSPGLGRGGPT